jgi:hypothetical protein
MNEFLSEVLYKITEDIEKTIEFKIDKISTLLDEKSETFVANIKNDSNKTLSKLKDDLANREASIARDLKLIKNINQLKRELSK